MPELRDRYDGGTVSDWITQPPFADLEDRARHRVHRNRAAGVAGLAVITALVAVPLLVIPGDDRPGTSAQPSPSVPIQWSAFSMEFYDLSHGYGAYQVDDACTGWLSATGDGGSTWSELRELPGPFPDESGCFRPRVVPVAPQTLVMAVTLVTLAREEWVDLPSTAFISRDAGLTWQEYQPRFETADVVPDGVAPEARCLDDACEQVRLGWYDPLTGNPTLLADTPPAAAVGGRRVEAAVAADGSIWVAGVDSDLDYHVSVSRDRGRSWQTESPDQTGVEPESESDDFDLADHGAAIATSDGTTAYLSAWQATEAGGQVSFHRTTDGGRTWQLLAGDHPFTSIWSMWVSPDGTLTVVDDLADAYRSTDGGASFRGTDVPWLKVVPVAGGFFGWASGESAVDGVLSEDGLTWQPFQVPDPWTG